MLVVQVCTVVYGKKRWLFFDAEAQVPTAQVKSSTYSCYLDHCQSLLPPLGCRCGPTIEASSSIACCLPVVADRSPPPPTGSPPWADHWTDHLGRKGRRRGLPFPPRPRSPVTVQSIAHSCPVNAAEGLSAPTEDRDVKYEPLREHLCATPTAAEFHAAPRARAPRAAPEPPAACHPRADRKDAGFRKSWANIGWECVQEAGELMFVPPRLQHAVVNIGETVTVTHSCVPVDLPCPECCSDGRQSRLP